MITEIIKVIASLWLTVAIHEGGHALAVRGFGGEIREFNVSLTNPHVTWRGVDESNYWIVDLGGLAANQAVLPAIRWAEKKYPDESTFNYLNFFNTAYFPYMAITSLFSENNDLSQFCKDTGTHKVIPVALSLIYLKLNENVYIDGGKIFYRKAF
jgi:hypothetical protein